MFPLVRSELSPHPEQRQKLPGELQSAGQEEENEAENILSGSTSTVSMFLSAEQHHAAALISARKQLLAASLHQVYRPDSAPEE